MNPNIPIKKVTLHFIYSFLPVAENLAIDEKILQLLIKCCADSEYFLEGKLGKPENRRGLSTYLALKHDMAYIRLSNITGKIDNLNIVIEPTIRLFPLGSTCCLTVHASTKDDHEGSENKDITISDVHKLLHMVSQKHNDPAKFRITNLNDAPFNIENNTTTLFNLYNQITETMVNSYNELTPEDARKLIEKATREEGLTDEKTIKAEGDAAADAKEKVEKLKLIGKENANTSLEEYQTPWVISVIELLKDEETDNPEVYNAFCSSFDDESIVNPLVEKHKAIRKYEKQFAPILYRSVMGENFQIEPAYTDLVIGGRPVVLYNMNVDARLFVQTSRRSVMCICNDQTKDPAAYFLPGLIDLCEMIFSRSNTMIILNRELDKKLKNFSGKDMSAQVKLNRIISVINHFTSCLEDPSSYVISGDALREIHEKLIDTTRVNSLTDIVLKKIDMLERLYKYKLQATWADKL